MCKRAGVCVQVCVHGRPVVGSPFAVQPYPGFLGLGRHVRTYAIEGARAHVGLVISPDGALMAVSNYRSGLVHIYATGDGALVRVVGVAPGPVFANPYQMCPTPGGTLLVTELAGRRVQEITWEGEHVRFLGQGVLEEHPYSCQTNGEVVVVGRTGDGMRNRVHMFDYASGSHLLSFCERGSVQGRMDLIAGFRFTPDGTHLLYADYSNQRLSKWTVGGDFVCVLCPGQFDHPNDVDFTVTGEIVVADCYGNRVCVVSPDGSTLVRSWGRGGLGDGEFQRPAALAVHGRQLYVLDFESARVQVFE